MGSEDTDGLWSSMTYGGHIRDDRWKRAAATGEVVGTCFVCGGYLIPDDPGWARASVIQWFVARCLDCGHEVAAPGGRLNVRKRGRYGP